MIRIPGRLAAIIVMLALLTFPPTLVSARQGVPVEAEMTVSVRYGDSLVFGVRASATNTIIGARLTVQVDRRDRLYSEAIVVTRGTTVEIAYAVPVSELDLPPFAGLSYYWDFQSETGQEYRTETQHLWYEDVSVPWRWAISTRGNVVVHTDGQDLMVSQVALETAGNALSWISRTLGTAYEDELHVYVYPELAPLASSLRLHGQRVQDRVAVYAIPDQSVVLVSAAPGPDLTVNLQRDLPHGVTHVVVGWLAGASAENVPGWFNEGLALMSAYEPDPALQSVLERSVREGSLLPLETLCAASFGNFSPQESELAYAQSESVMRYITERYGTSQVRALLAAYQEGLSCDNAVRRALGISLTELESQWHNAILNEVAHAPRQNISLLPWVVVWLVSMGLALLFIAPQPQGRREMPALRSGPSSGVGGASGQPPGGEDGWRRNTGS